ncbi:sulfhydryl oxidase 1-like [Schistocerca cancellata]|uniref:sulfhydryl oxidase 1-like n=1 Tax=Schistocerca cancellata TaxID=274614 RepID=UPI002119774E|nr:sulfhydryl oxidase 1-like [Schistocerca cancellata]
MSLNKNVIILVSLMLLALGVIATIPARHILNVTPNRGLYDDDSKVTVLNTTSFKTAVFHTNNAWLVEFYSSWCGFCQRYAPTWKAVAASTYGWKDVLISAAVDCANEDNTPLCREYEIMKYPTVKFFGANTKAGDMGTEIAKGNSADELVHNAINMLKKEQADGRGFNWPNITPYRSTDVQNLWKNAPESVQYIFLIFEESDSYIGSEVILDLHFVKGIQIRNVLNQNEALAKLLGISSYPSMIVLERSSTPEHLRVVDKTREEFRKAIEIFLRNKGIEFSVNEQTSSKENKDSVLNYVQNVKENGKRQPSHDVVFQADLELAVQYSLKHEIPLKNVISGKMLDALRNYLSVLAKYFPTESEGKAYLRALQGKALANVSQLKGSDFLAYVKKLEQGMKYSSFISNRDWVGCKGSSPIYRGYPCGLWTLFHTLTVNSVLQNGTDKNFKSLEVLDAMLGYITHFFGCHDCSLHFQEMAAESMHSDVLKPEDSIMWLWKAHNKVNKRLAGDTTEDPKHPKIQFPSRDNCPVCRLRDGSWDYNEILKYVKLVYRRENIKTIPVEDRINQHSGSNNFEVSELHSNSFSSLKNAAASNQRFGWNFNIFDVSLCVILYLVSACILLLVFLKFIVRKKYKKKYYVHDLLGKV